MLYWYHQLYHMVEPIDYGENAGKHPDEVGWFDISGDAGDRFKHLARWNEGCFFVHIFTLILFGKILPSIP